MLNFITKLGIILLIFLATLDIHDFRDKTCFTPRAPQAWLNTERLEGIGFCVLVEAYSDINTRYSLASGG